MIPIAREAKRDQGQPIETKRFSNRKTGKTGREGGSARFSGISGAPRGDEAEMWVHDVFASRAVGLGESATRFLPLVYTFPGCYLRTMNRQEIIARLRENEAALR